MQDVKRCIVSLISYHFTTTGFHFLFQFLSSVQAHDGSVEVVFCFRTFLLISRLAATIQGRPVLDHKVQEECFSELRMIIAH